MVACLVIELVAVPVMHHVGLLDDTQPHAVLTQRVLSEVCIPDPLPVCSVSPLRAGSPLLVIVLPLGLAMLLAVALRCQGVAAGLVAGVEWGCRHQYVTIVMCAFNALSVPIEHPVIFAISSMSSFVLNSRSNCIASSLLIAGHEMSSLTAGLS